MSEHQVLVFTPHILGPGVHQDLPDGLLDDIAKWSESFPGFVEDMESLLTNNRIFKQRTVDIGAVNQDEAQSLGFTEAVHPCFWFAVGFKKIPSLRLLL